MFDLAAKLVWEGGEDVYSAGSKNISKLYEYWLFFKVLEAVKETFEINSDEYKKLISATDDTLGLKLKEGKQVALNGIIYQKKENYQFNLPTIKRLVQVKNFLLKVVGHFKWIQIIHYPFGLKH